jgi:nitrogen fixation protein FixH
MTRRFTGRHMLVIFLVGFGIVIAVNFEMAHLAVSTFTGETVENSYVASQRFNRWLDEAGAEKALGWSATVERGDQDKIILRSATLPPTARIIAEAREPLGRLPDQRLTFVSAAPGRWTSTSALPEARWTLRIEVADGAHRWRTEEEVR